MSETELTTRDLAIKLGLIEVISVNNPKNIKNFNKQSFEFLLVLDFESTCWNRDVEPSYSPEIIEFSVVLYDVKKTKIITEYQQYVMPIEHSKLSEFCSSLTGITQRIVDKGVPLPTCLMLFNKWLNEVTDKHQLSFDLQKNHNKCVFVTWSDWDLGNCLKNECRRKNLRKPPIFNKWIDIRALYKEYYHRRPNGLNGALAELGLTFEGREHCGLHDARNTAYLITKMLSEGLILRITKEI